MTKSTNHHKRTVEHEDATERTPLSPITSPSNHPKHLTKRQEQNREAQRAFRERRAQTLKEMEIRLSRLEVAIEDFRKSVGRIATFETELMRIKCNLESLYSTVDSLVVPTWAVPTSEELNPAHPSANEPIGALLSALRPSSTDPTLSSNS